MQRFLKKLSCWIFSYHKIIVLFSVFITILTTLFIFRITIKTDMLDFFPANNPIIRKFVDFLNDFGSIDNLVIVIESKENIVDNHIEFVELIVEKLKGSPLVEDIDYNIFHAKGDILINNFPLYIYNQKGFDVLKKRLTETGIRTQVKRNRYMLLSPFSSPIDNMFISKDPLDIKSILKDQFIKKGPEGLAFKGGYYISKDNSTLLIFVKPAGSSRDIKFMREIKDGLDNILTVTLKDYVNSQDLRIGYMGAYALASEAQETIKKDIIYSFIYSVILIILLFKFVYKITPMVLIVAVATLFAALSWTLGIAYLLFGGLNVITSIVATMLMGLGIDYIIHIFKRYEKEFIKQRDPLNALETTLTKTGVGVMTGAITTTLAFFSIIFTSFKGLHRLGIVAGLGVLSCLFLTMVVMTSLLIWIGKTMPHHLFQVDSNEMGTIWIARLTTHHPKFFLFIGTCLFVVSILGLFNVSFDTSPENMGIKDSLSQEIENRVAKKFGKQKNPIIIIGKKETEEELFSSFDAIEAKLEDWQKKNIIESYTSIDIFIPSLSKQAIALTRLADIRKSEDIHIGRLDKTFLTALEKNDFIVDEYSVRYIKGIQRIFKIDKPIKLGELKEDTNKKIKYFYNRNKLKMAAYIFPKDGHWEEMTLETIKNDLSVLDKDWILLGSNLIFKELKDTIILESLIAGTVAFVVIFGMLYLQFKSIKGVALVLIPLFLGFVYTIGLMGILDISFNYVNIGAISLLFGIGVDYGIYILQEYLEGDRPDIERAVQQVGMSVIMCGMTTIVGFGSLATMRFMGVASLGIVISIGVSFCLFAAIIFLPALLHSMEY